MIHQSKRYHAFAFLMLMCCLFAVMSTCNWILIHYTFNEPLVGGGGAVFVSMMPSVPDAGVEKESRVCVEVHLVRANSTPLRKTESSSGFVPLVSGLPRLPPTERTSGRPTLSCPLSPSDISGPESQRAAIILALLCFVLFCFKPVVALQIVSTLAATKLPATKVNRTRSSSRLVRSQIFLKHPQGVKCGGEGRRCRP